MQSYRCIPIESQRPTNEVVYDSVFESTNALIKWAKKNPQEYREKYDFLKCLRTQDEFDNMFAMLQLCYEMIAETSYFHLENGRPPYEERFYVCGVPLTLFALILKVWDGKEKNLFYYINEYASRNFNKEVARQILAQQEDMDILFKAIHIDWKDSQEFNKAA